MYSGCYQISTCLLEMSYMTNRQTVHRSKCIVTRKHVEEAGLNIRPIGPISGLVALSWCLAEDFGGYPQSIGGAGTGGCGGTARAYSCHPHQLLFPVMINGRM